MILEEKPWKMVKRFFKRAWIVVEDEEEDEIGDFCLEMRKSKNGGVR